MVFVITALVVYSTVATALYLHVQAKLNDVLDSTLEYKRIAESAEPYIAKLTEEVESYKNQLDLERSARKAEGNILKKLRKTLEPAEFYGSDSGIKDNQAKHAPEETARSFE